MHGLGAAWRSRGASRSRLEGRPLGIRWPWGRASATVLWGSAVAPPLVLLAALVGAAATGRRDWLGGLGGVLVVGQLSEPIVYERSGLPEDRWVRRSVVANLALGSMLVARWRAAAYGSGRVGSAAGR